MKLYLTGPHAYSSVHNEGSLSLAGFLGAQGWTFVDSPTEADVICAVEVPVNTLHLPTIPSAASKKGLLLIQEPSVVRPFHRKDFYQNRFARLIELGRTGEFGHQWPALYLHKFSEYSKTPKLSRACLIGSNKVSLLPGELYTLRRLVIDATPVVDLYGQGWNASKSMKLKQLCFELYNSALALRPPSLRPMAMFFSRTPANYGSVQDKLEVNSRYKVSVVIENSSEFMSEKLLEAISAGSIPVYVGPEPSKFGIPDGLTVWVDPNVESIQDGISRALRMDYSVWASLCSEWITDSNIQLWSLERYWDRVHRELQDLASNFDRA
jgi:hypothetical protein